MTNIELHLKNKIMRRVYATWLLRRLFSLQLLRITFMAIVVFQFAREVSVMDVIHNIPGESLSSGYNYFAFAFSHTELSVQLYILGIFTIIVWYFFGVLRKTELLKISESKLS